jgi:signal peptidase I
MYPFFKPGDRLVVKKTTYNRLRPGDVVLYRNLQSGASPGMTAHRIIKTMSTGPLVTKGDNMHRSDPAVRLSGDLMGPVVMIIRRGRVIPLNKGLHAWMGRLLVYASRKNMTPGLILSRLKTMLGLHH